MDQEAASEAIASFPLTDSLNPALRSGNDEAYYLGLSMVLGLALAALFWRQLPTWSRSLLVTALVTTLISSTVVNEVYKALPFHQLFWPIRFLPNALCRESSATGPSTTPITKGGRGQLWRRHM